MLHPVGYRNPIVNEANEQNVDPDVRNIRGSLQELSWRGLKLTYLVPWLEHVERVQTSPIHAIFVQTCILVRNADVSKALYLDSSRILNVKSKSRSSSSLYCNYSTLYGDWRSNLDFFTPRESDADDITVV